LLPTRKKGPPSAAADGGAIFLDEGTPMKTGTTINIITLALAAVIFASCRSSNSSSETVIKSVKSGELTVTLSSANGDLRNGDNEVLVTFSDASGKTVDAGAVSLNFHMPAMASMAEMNDHATLTTTETPGKYLARVRIEGSGTWEAQIKYQGPHGQGQTSINVHAK
jgi:nitrogen fixation protein FixH